MVVELDGTAHHAVGGRALVGLLAHWSGLGPREPVAAAALVAGFDLARVPRRDVTFRAEDDAWLFSRC